MRLLINAFIIFHLFLIIVWLFPINQELLGLINILRGYIIFLGLDQDYSMFAPSLRKQNRHLFALVTYQDQSTRIWIYPRVDRMPYWLSTAKERYRKFGSDNIVQSCFKAYWPDFARYIARQNTCIDNPAQIISIFLTEEDILNPDICFNAKSKTIGSQSHLTHLFTYKLETGNLRIDQ